MDDRAFIVFTVGPVQSFISAARTLRDLWTGSFLLAWLTRQAMEPILKACGPQAFIEPDMSQDPMSSANLKAHLRSPCLPNRFLAEVPADRAETLANECREAFDQEWWAIADQVRQTLGKEITQMKDGWQDSVDRLWDAQVKSFFDVRVTVVPWEDCPPATVAELLGKRSTVPPSWNNASADDILWTDRAELAARVHATHKVIRKVTSYHPQPDRLGMLPAKCSLLGSYEYLGPAELGEAARFWQTLSEKINVRGTRVRAGERLCAVSLVKRFAWAAYFATVIEKDPRAMRLDDLATIAAAEWLREKPILDPDEVRKNRDSWSGQWLHWNRPDMDKDEEKCPDAVWKTIKEKREKQGAPPAYYAILMMDGDRMGQHLRARPGREHPRTISKALAKFALHCASKIVENHLGVLIYCGGDDVLALLPTTQVCACAQELNAAFREVWSNEVLKGETGNMATLSAGIAVVHYKEDLRFALDTAREAERYAKNNGRDIIAITVCRRSGEHTTALCPWTFVPTVERWVQAFTPTAGRGSGASDRWARHLYREMPVLEGLPREAMLAEIRRQVDRAEETTRRFLSPHNPKEAGSVIAEQFKTYWSLAQPRGWNGATMLRHFLTLCQTASFLARRRDE